MEKTNSTISETPGTKADVRKTSDSQKAMVIIGVLFFVFGFVTWLNGTLIPFLKLAYSITSHYFNSNI